MKIKLIPWFIYGLVVFCSITTVVVADSSSRDDSIFRQSFDLAGERSEETQYFLMETRIVNYAPDGTRMGRDLYTLHLKYMPANLVGKTGGEYTSVKFKLKTGDSPEITIPALEGWKYVFKTTSTGIDEKGQVFGINHSKFENLVDNNGKPIPQDKAYPIYNTFVDFHAFNNEFAERTSSGNGIQSLNKIGEKIVHSAAFSESPVHVGINVAGGSFFKNGEITLAFKGLSIINEATSAIVGFDSGESSFKMIVNLSPDMEIQSVGSSHYKDDIYINLESKWIQKIVMDEVVVSEVTLTLAWDLHYQLLQRLIILMWVDRLNN
jgi:hypothetical protein